jgi:hypothetical protein
MTGRTAQASFFANMVNAYVPASVFATRTFGDNSRCSKLLAHITYWTASTLHRAHAGVL